MPIVEHQHIIDVKTLATGGCPAGDLGLEVAADIDQRAEATIRDTTLITS